MTGPRIADAAHDVDAHLAHVAHGFDLVSQVTPANAEEAWVDFHASGCERVPHFTYRPPTSDLGQLRDELRAVQPESVDDPALVHLFRATQAQLDRQLTMLSNVGRREFLDGSLQVYGGVEPHLAALAESILEVPFVRTSAPGPFLDAAQVRRLAAAEVRSYRDQAPDFGPLPRVSPETYGMIVTHGQLMIGADVSIPVGRADALLQHEVGTHMLTYYNGRAQPLRLLSEGLPGYEETQEGLSVLAEYLTGGLDVDRIRIIAARVIAVRALIAGAGFVEAFRLISGRGLAAHSAFSIVVRVYRGGGLTKDADYLRGLAGILRYTGDGGDLTRLFVGKLSIAQLPVIEELLARGVLVGPRILPRYLGRAQARERLDGLRSGVTVLQLIDEN